MLYRILTVRRHKKVTFCDAYSFRDYRQQLVFYHDQLDCEGLTIGCTAELSCHPGKNNRGVDVWYVDEIHQIFPPANTTSYKGFQQENLAETELAQDLNGGIHLRCQRFRLQFLRGLRKLLEEKGLSETHTPITGPYRGTSVASPVRAEGRYIGRRYIKITHELGLKMQCYLLLEPVYEIGYVMRDRYVTQSGLNEFLTLEAVLPQGSWLDIGQLYRDILQLARRLAGELELAYDPIFDDLKVLDAKAVYLENHSSFSREAYLACYEKLVEENPHCIIYNAPLESPLGIAGAEGLVMETKWLINGHGFGHGYPDEYRPAILRETFASQQEKLLAMGIDSSLPEDYLTVCEYAGIPTLSFNLGLDRFLNCFFGQKLE